MKPSTRPMLWWKTKVKNKNSASSSIRYTSSKRPRDTKIMQAWPSSFNESMPTKIKYWMNSIDKWMKLKDLKKKVNRFLNLLNRIRWSRGRKNFLSFSTSMRRRITPSRKTIIISSRGMKQLWSPVMPQCQIPYITGFITAARCGCKDLMSLPELQSEWINLIFKDSLMAASFVARKAATSVRVWSAVDLNARSTFTWNVPKEVITAWRLKRRTIWVTKRKYSRYSARSTGLSKSSKK